MEHGKFRTSGIVGCYGFVKVCCGTVARRGRTMVMGRRMDGEFADKFSVAPMMDVTDRHFNTFARSISKHATLWSEMLVDSTAIYNPERTERFFKLGEDVRVGPTVLQLGGSDPNKLAQAASYVQDFGYDEINLNCGCPSDRVSGKGCFGAALMKTPDLVADITARMSAAVRETVPISVKCRIGVDDIDSYESLRHFIETVSSKGGVKRFVIHARKAILKGLSPAQNRSIPPLKYDYVYRLIDEFPDLYFTINGGVSVSKAFCGLRIGLVLLSSNQGATEIRA
uniref:DUS-like FMN-binding domain-containing protein n=1 Tax=Rhodosorus marinus TaxID=101924 RepID=A0A7S3A1N0_9RHOD|mmetsp:Transcript_41419/g.163105  ORF Transcript_41419/g.163105 Transcript_41419/m.163105 type:complete len:283 (+) Transcript_41419:285-1133(+)